MKTIKNLIVTLIGTLILSFALYNIHSFSNITEGGVLGLTLFLYNMFGISPALSSFLLNAFCFCFGWRILGKNFAFYSAVAAASFSLLYKIFEQFPVIFPDIAKYPFAAAILGAVLVGIGVGICVRVGGAPTGDDALAMSISHLTKLKIQWVYLISDVSVLFLSLFYIPIEKIWYSLFTVILSGQIIGFIQSPESYINKLKKQQGN